ncbi:MAG TPA: hypothetical protein VMT80_00410 [Candidatus Paceibacterota bacterium]|nr:hypothetical protein [Candidatus Paceibacterota bacterium]
MRRFVLSIVVGTLLGCAKHRHSIENPIDTLPRESLAIVGPTVEDMLARECGTTTPQVITVAKTAEFIWVVERIGMGAWTAAYDGSSRKLVFVSFFGDVGRPREYGRAPSPTPSTRDFVPACDRR